MLLTIDEFRVCPEITMLYVAPLVAPVGAKVVLEVETSDTEDEGAGLDEVEWTASSGQIDDPVATETFWLLSLGGGSVQ